MAHYYEFNGIVPIVPEDIIIHPQAVLKGDVMWVIIDILDQMPVYVEILGA